MRSNVIKALPCFTIVSFYGFGGAFLSCRRSPGWSAVVLPGGFFVVAAFLPPVFAVVRGGGLAFFVGVSLEAVGVTFRVGSGFFATGGGGTGTLTSILVM